MPTLKYRDPADGQFKPLIGGSSGGEAGGTATTVDGLPLGAILPYPSATPPTDWLLCDGAAIPAEYADLIALIGANTPNLLGKFVAGAGGAYALNATGGADTVALTATEMPSHAHGGVTAVDSPDHTHAGSTDVDWPDHTHVTYGPLGPAGMDPGSGWSGSMNNIYTSTGREANTSGGASARHTHAFGTGGATARHAHGVTAEGGNAAHENRPPYVALTYIIKAKLADVTASPGDYATKQYVDAQIITGITEVTADSASGWATINDIPVGYRLISAHVIIVGSGNDISMIAFHADWTTAMFGLPGGQPRTVRWTAMLEA